MRWELFRRKFSLKINKSHTIDFQYEGNNSSLIININSDGKLYFQLFIDKGDYYFESLEDLKGILDTYNVNYNSTL